MSLTRRVQSNNNTNDGVSTKSRSRRGRKAKTDYQHSIGDGAPYNQQRPRPAQKAQSPNAGKNFLQGSGNKLSFTTSLVGDSVQHNFSYCGESVAVDEKDHRSAPGLAAWTILKKLQDADRMYLKVFIVGPIGSYRFALSRALPRTLQVVKKGEAFLGQYLADYKIGDTFSCTGPPHTLHFQLAFRFAASSELLNAFTDVNTINPPGPPPPK